MFPHVDDDAILAPQVERTRMRSFLRVNVAGKRTAPSLSGRADKITLTGSADRERTLTGEWET